MAASAVAEAGSDEATARADILKLFEFYDNDKSGFMCVVQLVTIVSLSLRMWVSMCVRSLLIYDMKLFSGIFWRIMGA